MLKPLQAFGLSLKPFVFEELVVNNVFFNVLSLTSYNNFGKHKCELTLDHRSDYRHVCTLSNIFD